MSNVIQHKRNSTPGVIPAATGIQQGELAINIGDGKFYTKDVNNNIINLGITSISGTYITPSSGNFSTGLTVNGVDVSLSGHMHTSVQQAQSIVTTVFNETGATIPKMTAVYINGGHGDRPTIQKAIATSDMTSAGTYGLTYSAIDNMQLGEAIVFGALTGVNTDPAHGGIAGATEGSVLYLSPTVSGAITTTKPYAPYHIVSIGTVVRVHQNEGVIEVRVQNGFELDELHNVAITGATNGQFLQYNSGSGLWVPSSSGNFSSLTINNNQIITGTGVANHVAYWNSTSGIVADSGQLVWDSTNNRLGIGTSTPSGQLHVAGNLLVEDSGPYSIISATESSGLTIYGNSTLAGAGILFTDRTNGRIGIGTDSPNANLAISAGGAGGTISGSAQSQPFQINDATASDYINLAHFNITNSSSRGSFTLSNNSSSAWENNVMQFFVHGSTYAHAYYGGNASDAGCAMIVTQGSEITKLQIGNISSVPIEFFTGNAFRAIIDGAGNVGIGAPSPSAKLDVNGDANIDGNLTFDSFTESVVDIGNSSTTQTIDLTSGTVQTCTLTGNCTFTMPTATAGKSFSLFLNTGTGGYSATFTGVRWSDSTPPTITSTASKVDLLSFISDGTYWYGSFSQNYG